MPLGTVITITKALWIIILVKLSCSKPLKLIEYNNAMLALAQHGVFWNPSNTYEAIMNLKTSSKE